MAKKRKAKKAKAKKSKVKSTKAKKTKLKRRQTSRKNKPKKQPSRDVDVLSPVVSDEALEREGLTSVVKTVMNPATVCCY